jgi:hypothetical protein
MDFIEDIVERVDNFYNASVYRTGAVAILLNLLFSLILILICIKSVVVGLYNGASILHCIYIAALAVYTPAIFNAAFLLWTCTCSPFFRNVFTIAFMPFLILWTVVRVLPVAGYDPPPSFSSLKPYEQSDKIADTTVEYYKAAQRGEPWAVDIVRTWEANNKPRKYLSQVEEYKNLAKQEREEERLKHADDDWFDKLLIAITDRM